MDYPRTYAIVRQGESQVASVANLEELIALRTELELIRRFGAGATIELIDALDRRIAQMRSPDWTQSESSAPCAGELQEVRAILSDSLSPANRQAVAQIDQECPQARAGVAMESIEQDTKDFRDDVTAQLQNAEIDDVDALLATFEQASQESSAEQSPAGTTGDEDLDADLQALLAQVSEPASDDSELAQLAASLDAPEAAPALPQTDTEPVELVAASEPDQNLDLPVGEVVAESAPAVAPDAAPTNIEAVTEQVSETLTNAEAQLDAIASAFEVAAAELGDISAEVAQAVPTLAEPQTADAPVQTAYPEPQPIGIPVEQQSASSAPAPELQSAVSLPSESPRRAGQLRGQLQRARANILSELDDLLVMLDRVDQMQVQADQAVRKAREFEQAATRAHQANQVLADAEAEAAKARAAFEQAQCKVNGARTAWESAQCEAALAAAATREAGL